jgi:hypothetical protein
VDRNQAEEISRAADRITEAVRELTFALNRFLEHQERYVEAEHNRDRWQYYRRPGELLLGFLGAGELPDEEAGKLAQDTVHRARTELGRTGPFPPPRLRQVEDWEHWRDERRRREGS